LVIYRLGVTVPPHGVTWPGLGELGVFRVPGERPVAVAGASESEVDQPTEVEGSRLLMEELDVVPR
jgi:hypothetical protein